LEKDDLVVSPEAGSTTSYWSCDPFGIEMIAPYSAL